MTSVKIKFKKLFEDAKLPTKGTDKAACFDFYVHRIEFPDPAHRTAILYFGLACEFPDDYVLTFQPRSGFNFKGWEMSNSPGQIDSDYRGELQMRIQAIPNQIIDGYVTSENKHVRVLELVYPPLPFDIGDRCLQGKLEQVIPVEFEEVDELSNTERGVGGFGSTGK